jgi:putative endopeptidase
MRSRVFEPKEVNKLGKPIDRDEWGMTPQTVNAYYNPEMNEIVFPAAILQPPFFDANADDAVNYGAIGAVIGHEISHGFDDQGAQYDGDGNLRDWWTKADHKNFKAKTRCWSSSTTLQPGPGYHVNGELTLGENIADNSRRCDRLQGLPDLAERQAGAGDRRPDRRPALLHGLRPGVAQQDARRAADRHLKTDPHSPGQFRANGTVRNQPGFYERLRRQARRQDVPGAERPRHHLVTL